MFLLTALLIPRIISASLGYNQAFWGVVQCLIFVRMPGEGVL
jgi:hypothetical protein